MVEEKEDLELQFLRRARTHTEKREYAEAEYYFKKLVKINPKNWQVWYGRGLTLKAMELYSKAIYCFSKVQDLKEDFAKAWYNKGFCLFQIGDEEDALFHLNRAIKLDPQFPLPIGIKAKIFDNAQSDKNAHKLIKRMLEIEPDIKLRLQKNLEDETPLDSRIIINLLEELGY